MKNDEILVMELTKGDYIFTHKYDLNYCGKKVNHFNLVEKTYNGSRTFNFSNKISKETRNIIPAESVEKMTYTEEQYNIMFEEAIILAKSMSLKGDLIDIIDNSFTDVLDGISLQEHISNEIFKFIETNYSIKSLKF